MFRTETILSDDGVIEISALKEKQGSIVKYTMPWISISLEGQEPDMWDAEEYLVNELYDWSIGKDCEEEDFSIIEDYRGEIKEMIELAFEITMLNRSLRR